MNEKQSDPPSKMLSELEIKLMLAVRHLEMVVDIVYAMEIQFTVEGSMGSSMPSMIRSHLSDAMRIIFELKESHQVEEIPF